MTKEEKILKPKLGLLELAKQLENVSKAFKIMGYSRDTFYRYKDLYENGGMNALREKNRRRPIVAQEGEEQVQTLEKAKANKEAHGEIESEPPPRY